MDAPLPDGLVPAWEEFLSKPRTLDDLFAHPLLFPLQRRREMLEMFGSVCKQRPGDESLRDVLEGVQSYMEIGADKGGGLWAWLKIFPLITRVIACEIRGTPYSDAFERAFPHVRFLWLPWGSQEERTHLGTCRFVADGGGLDVLFLDGDKLQFGDDFELYAPLVRQGGTIFLHDVTDRYASARNRGPGDVWDRLKGMPGLAGRCSEIVDVGEVEPALDRQENGAALTEHEKWLCHWKGRSCGVGVVHV